MQMALPLSCENFTLFYLFSHPLHASVQVFGALGESFKLMIFIQDDNQPSSFSLIAKQGLSPSFVDGFFFTLPSFSRFGCNFGSKFRLTDGRDPFSLGLWITGRSTHTICLLRDLSRIGARPTMFRSMKLVVCVSIREMFRPTISFFVSQFHRFTASGQAYSCFSLFCMKARTPNHVSENQQ